MKQYLELLQDISENGRSTGDRTGTGTTSVFGRQYRYDLRKGLPIVTTKKIHIKSIVHELLWMLSGDTNIDYLNSNGVKIWDAWADENGELGPVYGAQWRDWNSEGIDQIQGAIDDLKNNPESRRIIVNAWNPSVLPDTTKSFSENVANNKAALPPCHSFFQFKAYDLDFYERKALLLNEVPNGDFRDSEIEGAADYHNIPRKILHLQLYQRSADAFLGVAFNIGFYSILLEMFAAQTGMVAGDFVHTFGDLHIYNNHKEQVALQLTREPKKLPTLKLNPDVKSIFDYTYDDIEIVGYESHPLIKGKVSV